MEKEIWKHIEGYESIYQISNYGNVKSLKRNVWHTRHGHITLQERMKAFTTTKEGRKLVSLSNEGINKTFVVHKLVAKAFIPNPLNLDCVTHKDGDNSNNYFKNLEWITMRDSAFLRENKNIRTSKHIGVYYEKNKNRWRASFYKGGTQKSLGTFKTEKEAIKAYKKEYIAQGEYKDRKYKIKLCK